MPAVRQNVKLIPKLIAGLQADPTQIMIDIKHTDFQKLAYQREVALRSGVLLKTDDDYVPAQIRLNDEVVKVKLRLKGDWTDHLQGDKWSYRVVVKGEKSIFGMKTFSIQHPKTRNYMSEWLFHRLLKYEGLIALRYDFIKAIINGKDLGVFALEEHFEKRLIEHNELREGPIIKFNENLLWLEKCSSAFRFRKLPPMAPGSICPVILMDFRPTNGWPIRRGPLCIRVQSNCWKHFVAANFRPVRCSTYRSWRNSLPSSIWSAASTQRFGTISVLLQSGDGQA